MILLSGGVKRTTATLSALFLLTIALVGLLDGCLALKCYECKSFSGYKNCTEGGIPTTTNGYPSTEECLQGQVCGREKIWNAGKVYSAKVGCLSINPTECQKGILGEMGACFTVSIKQFFKLQEECKMFVENNEGIGAGKRMSEETNGTSSSSSSARQTETNNWEFCTCTTDLCNAEDCKCMPASGYPADIGGGSGGGGSKGGSGAPNSLHHSTAGLGGRIMITTAIVMITRDFSLWSN